MITFDASEIANWADKPDARHRLPELVQRLALATCPMPSLIDMPSGSSVTMPGWDGVLEVSDGNAWAPTGASAWEFSVTKGPKDKADEDYAKRTAAPGRVDPSKTTFVFVTPRRWSKKNKWADEKRKEGQWADVRALDANALVAWLGAAPAVARWFATLIGKMSESGWTSLDDWWTHWASVAKPEITPELVLAGRGEEADALGAWARGEPDVYSLRGAARSEAIAFLAACARANAGSWGAALMARAVVVETVDAWRSLENHYIPLALIRDFTGGVSAKVATEKEHQAFLPLGAREDVGGGRKLPLLGRDETPQALMEMGLSEEQARAHTRKSARRLLVLRRRLIDEAGFSPPEWVAQASPVAPLALIGKWDEEKEADRKIVAEVTGKPYEEAERAVQELSNLPDAPLARIGSRWTFVSPEEAWHLLAPRITRSEMERFIEVAVALLRTESPKFDLPVGERYAANIFGKAMPHSDDLRSGIAQGLALMGVYPDRAKGVDAADSYADRAVYHVLNEADWRTWATLYGDLQTLAEAAPNAFLNAVDAGLSRSPSPFTDLFAQEDNSGGGFGEAAHPGLLWALKTLAWSEEHFPRAAKALACLSEIDPGWRLSNRPNESLSTLFLPWRKFTEAPDAQRIETLGMLLKATPQVGWQTLLHAYPYPSPGQTVLERGPSAWQPWARDGAPAVTDVEFAFFVKAMDRLVLENVGVDAERWAELVGAISRFSLEVRRQAIGMLTERADAVKQHPASSALWEKIRSILHRHRIYPHAEWAMPSSELESLDKIYDALAPSDPVKAYAWLFSPEVSRLGAGLPNPEPISLGNTTEGRQANERLLEEERQKAVRQAYEHGKNAAILGIAEEVDYTERLGLTVGLALDNESAFDLALPGLGSPAERVRLLARGVLQAMFRQNGWAPLEQALAVVKQRGSMPDALANVYRAAPFDASTWKRLALEEQVVQGDYWKSVDIPLAMIRMDIAHFSFAVDQLIAANRAADVVEPAAMRENVPASTIVKVLEHAPIADSHEIALLLEKLDASNEVSDETIARLEVPYLDALHYGNRKMKIHEQVIKSPRVFAYLISCCFKRSDGQIEDDVDDQTRMNRAQNACAILSGLRGVPGMTADGDLDAEALETWVSEARRLCTERDRAVIGDKQIGQLLANAPTGADGIWPCEPVRDLLDKIASPHVGVGFTIGKRSLRGVTRRGVFDGGAQETSIAARFLEDAQSIAARWPVPGALLRDIAASYDSESQGLDDNAAWNDQF